MARERNERDWAEALQRHRNAQALDLQAFRTELEIAVQQELGNEWRQDHAARSLIERLIAQQEVNKKATVQEFFNEASSFLQEKYSLAVTPCPVCARQHSPKVEIVPLELELPPFHPTCTCEVNWRHEWVFSEPSRGTESLDASIRDWLTSAVEGIGIRAPSLRDLLTFERARLCDAESSTLSAAVDCHHPRGLPLWKRIVAPLSRK